MEGHGLRRDRVVQDILRSIESGERTLGCRLLPEREMALHYHVSRTTIRDALRTLAALGVVSIEHGRGIYVRGNAGIALGQAIWSPVVMEKSSMVSLFEVRKTLETSVAGWAAQRASDAERTELVQLVTDIKQEMAHAGNRVLDMTVVADQAFHNTLLRASHNPVADRIMLNLLDVLGEARRHSLSITGRAWKSVLEHECIADAIARGNVEDSQAMMLQHLMSVEEEILKHL